MCEILLSIKPEYVKKLFEGSKKYEFRRKPCKRTVNKIVIYETNPTQKVVGEIEVLRILENSPERLWEETWECAGIEKEFFMEYFKGCAIAYCYEVKNVIMYSRPKTLQDYGISAAPQSFVYL